jgi:hypothetical protein
MQQSIPQTNPYAAASIPAPPAEKRQRKPLLIVDPVSHEAVKIDTQSLPSSTPATNVSSSTSIPTASENRQSESTTDSAVSDKEPVNDPNKTQIREDFRQKMANLLIDPPTAQTDKV